MTHFSFHNRKLTLVALPEIKVSGWIWIILFVSILGLSSFAWFSQSHIQANSQVSILNVNPAEINLYKLTNTARIAEGLAPLKWNAKLYSAAAFKADDMFSNQYFNHISPAGITPWKFIEDSGYQYRSAGENLAIDFNELELAVDAWLKSPSHRRNILDPNFTDLAIKVQEGTMEGRKTTVIIQMFGQPANAFNVLGDKVKNQVLSEQ